MSRLGAFLVQEGILTVADRQVIKRESAAFHGSFARSVLAMGLLDEDELTALMATKTGCQQVAKDILLEMDPDVSSLVPLHVLTWLEVLPLSVTDGLLRLAMVDTTDLDAINQIKFFTGLRVKPMIAKLSEIHRGLRKIGAPMDLGESGFEGLLRTLGRPPLESAIAKPKPRVETISSPRNVQHIRQATASVQTSSAPTPVPTSAAIGLDLADETLAAAAPEEALDEASVDLEMDIPQELTDEEALDASADDELQTNEVSGSQSVSQGTAGPELESDAGLNLDAAINEVIESDQLESSEQESAEIVHASPDEAIAEIAAENIEASQAPADLGLAASGQSETAIEDFESSVEENDHIDDMAEPVSEEITAQSKVAGYSDAIADDFNLDVSSSEPHLTDLRVEEPGNQPVIDTVLDAGNGEPTLDFLDTNESLIEASSRRGIADLNRVLISLQMTTDSDKAFKKVAEAACKVGINEGAIIIIRDGGVFPGVSWSKIDSKVEFVREVPAGHDENSIKKITVGKQPNVWTPYSDQHSSQMTHALLIQQHNAMILCIAAFNGEANHEGLRQTFGDVVRAVPVKN